VTCNCIRIRIAASSLEQGKSCRCLFLKLSRVGIVLGRAMHGSDSESLRALYLVEWMDAEVGTNNMLYCFLVGVAHPCVGCWGIIC
jgi:hypothetical protein